MITIKMPFFHVKEITRIKNSSSRGGGTAGILTEGATNKIIKGRLSQWGKEVNEQRFDLQLG